MTGTTIVSLSDEWIKSYAELAGVAEGTVIRSITEFQKDVDSYTEGVVKAGVDQIGALCTEGGFPRLFDYLPRSHDDSIRRLTPAQKQERKAEAEQEAIDRRKLARDFHAKFRAEQGMPPAEGD